MSSEEQQSLAHDAFIERIVAHQFYPFILGLYRI